MLINGRTEALEKVPESPREVWAADGSRMLRDYVIAGDARSRINAARDFLGGNFLRSVVLDNGPPGGTDPVLRYYIERTLPHDYPYGSTATTVPVAGPEPFLHAVSIPEGRPLGVGQANTSFAGRPADYTKYLMTVEYRTLSYDVETDEFVAAGPPLGGNPSPLYDVEEDFGFPDEGYALAAAPAFGTAALALGELPFSASRYVSRLFRPGGRFDSLRAGVLRFVDGTPAGTQVPDNIIVNRTFTTMTMMWHQVPVGGYPARAVERTLGCLNNATFDGFAAQTLMLTNAVPRPIRDPFGQRVLDVEYTFRYQPNVSPVTGLPTGQNAFFRTTGTVWDYVPVTASGLSAGSGIYRLRDFAALFRPDQD